MIIADHAELSDDKWRKLRKNGIGGSDAGACMGLSRYASPLTVCMDKTGRSDDWDGNEATEVGKILEPFLREQVAAPYLVEQGLQITDIGEAPHVYRSTEWPWMLANIDGFVELNGVRIGLEIKTGGSYQLREWGGVDGDEVPDTYYAQVQHYMAVTGTDWWIVFGLIGNRRLYRMVFRNEAFIDQIVEAERDVWEAVKRNDPLYFPAPTGLPAEDDALRKLTTPIEDADADLSDAETVVDRYYSLGQEIKDMETARKQAQQIIRQKMGTAKRATAGRYEITRTAYSKQQFEHGRFAKDHPEAITDYMREIEIDFPRVKEAR
jgi:putative phage-type endonuclease